MHIFKCFENQSYTYHDTQNYYLMEQDPLLLKDQADGMDVVSADNMEALKKKDGPSIDDEKCQRSFAHKVLLKPIIIKSK
jgi:hypothetical protein